VLYFSKSKIVIIYSIILFLSFFTFTNFIEEKNNFFLSKKVNLGLDLLGGSYLLLEVDTQPVVVQNLQNKLIFLRKFFKYLKIK
jgi:preprotein translocase subunit SecD/SecD/SecF fusion protein